MLTRIIFFRGDFFVFLSLFFYYFCLRYRFETIILPLSY